MTAAYVSAPRATASIPAIVNHWAELDPLELPSHYIGWGEPFCFGCGWLAPVNDANTEKALPRVWRTASEWLDRAHLKDHCLGGSGKPDNLVMLCHLCHSAMPSFTSRDDALRWVYDRADVESMFQLWTDAHLAGRYGTTGQTMVRSRMQYLEWLRN